MILQVKELKKQFKTQKGLFGKPQVLHAVDGVSFNINKGETLGLVGESGCGKSTTARLVLNLLQPTSGKVYFEGNDIFSLPKEQMRRLRQQIQIVLQDPYNSLNPRLTIERIVSEPLLVYHLLKAADERRKKVKELLGLVGLSSNHLSRYPHEFSGGQLQRIGIARALATTPSFLVLDEPVSSLDVSIAAQIINLLLDLQEEMNLTYLFISHDLRMVRQISTHVAVMYLGKIVEIASTDKIYNSSVHPYTKSLFSCLPGIDSNQNIEHISIIGELPSSMYLPTGCRFHTRCIQIQKGIECSNRCRQEEPPLTDIGDNHFVACFVCEK